MSDLPADLTFGPPDSLSVPLTPLVNAPVPPVARAPAALAAVLEAAYTRAGVPLPAAARSVLAELVGQALAATPAAGASLDGVEADLAAVVRDFLTRRPAEKQPTVGGIAVGYVSSGGGGVAIGGDLYDFRVMPTITVVLPPSQSPRLHQLRAPVGEFVGREKEIAWLVAQFQTAAAQGAVPAIAGVRGMGGSGKTELAYAVAARLAERFPDAQLLVELGGASATPLSAQEALGRVIHAFEPAVNLPTNLSELKATYASLLSGKRVLILADDARDAGQVEGLRPPTGSALLITSRNRFRLSGLGDLLEVGPLPRIEAVALLLGLCPRIGEAAEKLAALCGYLPLALTISAGLLREEDRPVGRYLRELTRSRLAALRDAEGDPDDPQASVEASLRLSWDALDATAQMVLTQLSVFTGSFDLEAAAEVAQLLGSPTDQTDAEKAPALVEVKMTWYAGRFVDPVTATKAESPAYLLEQTGAETAVAEILRRSRRRSLLEYDDTLARYSLHELVRVFVAGRLGAAEAEAAGARHAWHYLAVARRLDWLYTHGGNWRTGLGLFDQERAQIDAGWTWAAAHAGTWEGDRLLLEYANYMASVGSLRYDRRQEWVPRLESALAAARRQGNREGEGALLANLGGAYFDLGEVQQSIGFLEQALSILRSLGRRESEGGILGNLGHVLLHSGEVHRTIDYLEQALQIAREAEDQRGEGLRLDGLGTAYMQSGEVAQAMQYYEQALRVERAAGHRQGEAATLTNLGWAHASRGEEWQAVEFYEQALTITRELGDRPSEGDILSRLGSAYARAGEMQRAISYYEQHLALARAMRDRAGEGRVLDNLGTEYFKLGEEQRAVDFYEEALTITRELGDRQVEASRLYHLGCIYGERGEVRRAIEHLAEALQIERELGDREGEGSTLAALAICYEDLGEIDRATDYYEQALPLLRQFGDRLGESVILRNLGDAHVSLGHLRQATEYYEQALVLRDLEDQVGQAGILASLAGAYYQLGELRRAVGLFEQQLKINRAIGNKVSEGTTLGNLGLAYASLGELRRAIDYYEEAVLVLRETEDRASRSVTLRNLGNAYLALGEVRRAIDCYEVALALTRELGDRQGEGSTLGRLGVAHAAMGELEQAIGYYEKHLAIAREIGDQEGECSALGNLGVDYTSLGETRRAIGYLEQALAIARAMGNQSSEAASMSGLAVAHMNLDEMDRAVNYYQMALSTWHAVGDRQGEANTSWNLGLLFEKQGALAQAADLMQVLVSYEEEIGRPGASEDAARVAALRARLATGGGTQSAPDLAGQA